MCVCVRLCVCVCDFGVVFGVQGKMHFLILGLFILTHQAIAPQQQPQHIESMKLPKRENMPNGFVKLNTVFSPH